MADVDVTKKFQALLNKLFQFEASNLDFGVYRIFNYKRKEIEKFIEEDLKNKVETAFAKHKVEKLEEINEKFNKAKEEVIKTLGEKAFISGEIKDEFKDTPIAQEFLKIKAQKEEIEQIENIKLQVFNDLYNFFSRYYEEGDFIPQYRYSMKGHKYAIPYNGEEVKLYWANHDQYYIKTGLLFRDYTFKAGEFKVIFRVVEAKEELSSNKATKERFFVLDDENPVELLDDEKSLVIRFQYREITGKEAKQYDVEGGSNTSKQEKINQKSYEDILSKIKNPSLKELLSREYKDEKTVLLYQLNRFTAKNTRDYFIHKNLKKFLSEQLDYFVKSEVLDIDTLEKERFLDKHITRAKVVREIGKEIIDFLSQIEDFQKKLWEKKKFVLKTEYVITTDRIPKDFYDEIWDNQHQKEEWKALGFEIPKEKEELENLKLPVDTKYFSQDFKERLLEKLTENSDLDDLIDGILIKSENWQALNLLLNKYKEKIQTIYIDPPYNTGSDGFLYRDRYQHSSWLTMMENRLSLAKELMRDDGVIFVSIDDNELERLKSLMIQFIFDENKFLETFIWNNTQTPPSLSDISRKNVEYILTFVKSRITEKFRGRRAESNDAPLLNEGNPFKELVFPEGVVKFNIPDGIYKKGKRKRVELLDDVIVEGGFNKNEFRVICESKWSQETVIEEIKKGTIFLIKSEDFSIRYLRKNIESKWITPDKYIDSNFLGKKAGVGTNEDSKKELKNLSLSYPSYPKPSSLIHYLCRFKHESKIILDFFAGSGTTAHAVMKLNKEDGGKRKFILVEMAEYFDTVIIPRIKKVAYSFNWKDGKPQDTDGIGVFFKYHYLEQYEDTLDNIELKENRQALELFKDEYLLKYFLDFETRESPYLLNLEYLKNPFNYKLKVNLSEVGEPQQRVVDIPETFNYLLGLKVKKIKVRQNKGKYLFILGEKEGENIAIVWREYDESWKEEDFIKDKEFIDNQLQNDWKPHIVYINGQSVLTSKDYEVRYIEPEFKQLMEV